MRLCCCRCIWLSTRCTQTSGKRVRDTVTTDSYYDIQDINLSQPKRSNLVASVMQQVNVQVSAASRQRWPVRSIDAAAAAAG